MIYDVSMTLRDGMPVYAGNPPFRRIQTHAIEKGDAANESRLELGAHCGTHVDAPLHFVDGTGGVEAIPTDLLIGRTRVVHFPDLDRIDRPDLERLAWGDVKRVLFHTKNSDRWKQGGGFDPGYVFLTGEGARFLVSKGLRVVGTDGLGIEKPHSGDHPAHKALLGAGVVVIEGLCLADVPPGEYRMFCGPLRVAGGDGAPARVLLTTIGD